jgi:hypothetical protein
MTAKRNRVDLDLCAKIDILKQVDNNVKRKDIADKYGIDVSTLSKLVKNRDRIAEVIIFRYRIESTFTVQLFDDSLFCQLRLMSISA